MTKFMNFGDKCEYCGAIALEPSAGNEKAISYAPPCECYLEKALNNPEIMQDLIHDEENLYLIDELTQEEDIPHHYISDEIENHHFINNEFEINAANNFARLKKKYWVTYYQNTSISSPLYNILQKLDANYVLFDSDIEWLKSNRFFIVVANYYYQYYLKYNFGWSLPTACKFWRKAGFPQYVLNVTANFKRDEKKLMSAILTTRGGAFKDLNYLDYAETCANAAITYEPSEYPYKLLGAIYYSRGQPKEGDKFFQKANEFVYNPDCQDRFIQNALKKTGPVEQRRIALYLLQKDQTRYSWAKPYS